MTVRIARIFREQPAALAISGFVAFLIVLRFLGESSYLIYLEEGHFDRTEGPFVVGAGEVFVMGDNRHNSLDSRNWHGGRGGGVPIANIRGRAALRWLPTNRQSLSVSRARAEDLMDPALTDALAKCLRGH